MSRKKPLLLEHGETCFVCGQILVPGLATEEHVIPIWLQKMFGLWGSTYELGSGKRAYRYDRLRVPACEPCNSRLGRQLEEPMRRAVAGHELPSLDVVRLWLAKLSYGFAAADARYADQRERAGDVISHDGSTLVDAFAVERLLLEEVGHRKLIVSPTDWSSVFVYQTQTTKELPAANFDYIDDPVSGMVAIRAGCLGVVGFVLDGGFVADRMDFFYNAVGAQPLNPIQFREVAALAYSLAPALRFRDVTATHSMQPFETRVHVDVNYLSTIPEIPNLDMFADRLAFAWGLQEDDVRRGEEVVTSLFDDEGQPIRLGFNDAVQLPPS